jgi:hypothetical protein
MSTPTTFALNRTLEPSPSPSSTDRMLDPIERELVRRDLFRAT